MKSHMLLSFHCVSFALIVLTAANELYDCYGRGKLCFAEWFRECMSNNPAPGVLLTEKLDFMLNRGDFSSFEEPPVCNLENLRFCLNPILSNCKDENYKSSLEQYQMMYESICDQVDCLQIAAKCQQDLSDNNCLSEYCSSQKLIDCSKEPTPVSNRITSVLDSSRVLCQQEQCYYYLSTMPQQACFTRDGNFNIDELDSAEGICRALPGFFSCVLDMHESCFTFLSTLLNAIQIESTIVDEIRRLINDPMIQAFKNVYFSTYFKQDYCTGCLMQVTACGEYINWDQPSNMCFYMNRATDCIREAVRKCESLVLPSVRPVLNNVADDLVNFVNWYCGLVSGEDAVCYSKSVDCINLPSMTQAQMPGYAMTGFDKLAVFLGNLIGGNTDEIGIFWGQLCRNLDEISTCITKVVDDYCQGMDKQSVTNQFVVIDHVLRLICWATSGDYSISSLGMIPWFQNVNLDVAFQEILTNTFSAGLSTNRSLSMSMILDAEWNIYYDNPEHPATVVFKAQLEQTLSNILKDSSVFQKAVVRRFFQGSIGASFAILSNTTMTQYEMADLVKKLQYEMQPNMFQLDVGGVLYTVTELLMLYVPTQNGMIESVSITKLSLQCGVFNLLSACYNGQCINTGGKDMCECDDGYKGEFCQIEIGIFDGIQGNLFITFITICLAVVIAVPIVICAIACFRNHDKQFSTKIYDPKRTPMNTGQIGGFNSSFANISQTPVVYMNSLQPQSMVTTAPNYVIAPAEDQLVYAGLMNIDNLIQPPVFGTQSYRPEKKLQSLFQRK